MFSIVLSMVNKNVKTKLKHKTIIYEKLRKLEVKRKEKLREGEWQLNGRVGEQNGKWY